MKELIPIFWQMTDMVVDYSLEPFWVPDLHPRSQERPRKSGRVPDFKKKFIKFLNVSRRFGEFVNFCSSSFFRKQIFEKRLAKFRKIFRKFFAKNQEHFLTFEDVPDSWDGGQEPKIVPMCSQQPYLSFTKGLGLIPSSISE